jgi:protease-4
MIDRLKLLILLTVCGSIVCADYTGDVLRRESGVRATGMGGAYSAIAEDTSALFYNPAGLAKPGFQYSYMEDDLARHEGSQSGVDRAIKLGSFGYDQRTFHGLNNEYAEVYTYGFGVRTTTGLDYGLSYKHIVQENPDNVGNAWAADLGLLAHLTSEWRMGLTAQNFSQGNVDVKPSYRVGTAYQWNKVLFAYDHEAMHANDSPNGAQAHWGVEWDVSDGFALRCGSNNRRATYGFSLGFFGFIWDYGIEQAENEIIYRFGAKIGSEKYPEVREYGVFKQKDYLALDLSDNLVAGQSQYSFFNGMTPGVDYILNKIRMASEDKDIAGIIIRVSDMPNTLGYTGIVQELRAELKRFKSKGKYVIVYVQDGLSENTYYLISVADKIVMPKMGAISGLGKSLTINRYKGLLEKVGLEYTVLKQGGFKDSLNPYNEGFTPDQREHIEALVQDLNKQLLEDIKTDRKLTDEQMLTITDGSLITAQKALDMKLIDVIGYYDAATDLMKPTAKLTYEPKIIKPEVLPTYEEDFTLLPEFNTIAIVDVDGEITDGKSDMNFLFGGKTAGAETICQELKKLGDMDEVKAIVVRVNSPGGSPIGSDRIYQTLKKLREDKKKYIVISMGNMAASGGYYVAAAGNKIVANKGTLTGSIGVIGGMFKAKKLYEMAGIKEETVKTGEHMDMDALGRDLTEYEKQMLIQYMNTVYEQFKLTVAEGRNMHVNEVENLAQGKIYTGRRAKELKLVDEIGTIYDAIDIAKEGAGIKGKAKIIRVIKFEDGWFTLRSKASEMLGLDKIKYMFKSEKVEMKTDIY